MTIGLVVCLIVISGYFSNFLNWKFLNYKLVKLSYYFGTLIHESSHLIMCLLSGAKVIEFKVFNSAPYVRYQKPKFPFISNVLISLAPIGGGLFFLWFLNYYIFSGQLLMYQIVKFNDLLLVPWSFLTNLNFFQIKTWLLIFLFLNIGAIISPSTRDLKNMWLGLLILLFIHAAVIVNLGLIALGFIIINIYLQIILIFLINIIKFVFS
ncbi:MAG: hypothetical protein ACP5IC_01845 [Minisyncoccia bacterium]